MRRSLRQRLPMPAMASLQAHEAPGLGTRRFGWAYGLIAAWAVAMIGVPILRWTAGDAVLPWAITSTVLLLASANIVLIVGTTATSTAVRLVGVVLIGSWFVEFLGSTTGFPFSHYDYTAALQPQLAGIPVLIPFAWLMMLPSAWTLGRLLAPRTPFARLARALLAAAALTAWDLFLDPQMVAWGIWVWDAPGGYFGIPWINFAGWFGSAFVLTLLAHPPHLPYLPLLTIYTLTWALQTIGLALFWQMPGPALFGAAGMGIFVILGWRTYLKHARMNHAGLKRGRR